MSCINRIIWILITHLFKANICNFYLKLIIILISKGYFVIMNMVLLYTVGGYPHNNAPCIEKGGR